MALYASLRPRTEFIYASFSALGPDVVHVDPRHLDASIRRCADMHRMAPFTAVLNRKEKCVVPAALLATALGLPPITSEPNVARDKFAMRRALNGADVIPRTTLVREAGDLELVEADMFPCVIKPRFGFNSRSAVLVTDHGELASAYAEQHARYAAIPKQDGTNSDFVCEELVRGSEHTVETLVKDGLPLFHLVSDKLPMTPPFFVEIGDDMPSRLPAADQRICRVATERAIQALGIRNGWTHTEVKLDGGRAVVIECAARMGGGYFENLFALAYDLNRLRMLIDLHVGSHAVAPPEIRRHVAARRIVVSGPSRYRALENAATLFSDPRVTLVWPSAVSHIDRELAGPPHDFNNTLCEFIVCGRSGMEAAALADDIVARAVVRTQGS